MLCKHKVTGSSPVSSKLFFPPVIIFFGFALVPLALPFFVAVAQHLPTELMLTAIAPYLILSHYRQSAPLRIYL